MRGEIEPSAPIARADVAAPTEANAEAALYPHGRNAAQCPLRNQRAEDAVRDLAGLLARWPMELRLAYERERRALYRELAQEADQA